MARRGWIILISLFVGALVVIPLMAKAFDDNPREWLEDHYTHVSGDDPEKEAVVFSSDDDAATTATDIEKGTDADEKRQEGTTYYLRYDSDWMVVVSPDTLGARIELFEFDNGYRTHGGSVFFWNSHYGRGGGGFFRGGGSGSGK
jgi:Domain of unknown function (DUF4247)